jgi:hypothetical protein
MSDPIASWSAALDALNEHSDVRPLAELLRSDAAVPPEVRGVIAEMLDPKLGKHLFNVQLVPKQTNAFRKSMQRHFRDRARVAEIERQRETHTSVERAIRAAAERLRVSDETLWAHWKAQQKFWNNR